MDSFLVYIYTKKELNEKRPNLSKAAAGGIPAIGYFFGRGFTDDVRGKIYKAIIIYKTMEGCSIPHYFIEELDVTISTCLCEEIIL